MDILEQHRWIVALLERARRPPEAITPESLEENLYWLVQMAVPEVSATATLRARIWAAMKVTRPWRRWRPGRRWRAGGGSPKKRGAARPAPGPVPLQDEPFPAEEPLLLDLLLQADVHRLPDDACLQREARAVMRALLEGLPELPREALLLQVRHGLSPGEIAQVLGETEAQIQELLKQARQAIFGQGQNGGEA